VALGARVTVELGDVGAADDVARILARIDAELPPLRGIVQAAGALDDGVLLGQDWARFRTVLGPKVAGSWNLHRATAGRELDFFAIFSSFAGVLGLRGQSNHAAACAFQDALAHHRVARGLGALTIDWGAWSGVGAAVDRGVIERIATQGLLTITPEEGLDAFERALEGETAGPQVGVSRMDWPTFIRQYGGGRTPRALEALARVEPAAQRAAKAPDARPRNGDALAQAPPRQRRALLAEHVRACAARVLGAAPDSLDDKQPLGERGLDSLMAVELRGVLGRDLPLGRALPATLLFDYPTLDALTGYLARLLGADEGADAGAAPVEAPDARAALVSEVSELTDEEAELALLRELDSASGTVG
jgi:aryl carrier-like protein